MKFNKTILLALIISTSSMAGKLCDDNSCDDSTINTVTVHEDTNIYLDITGKMPLLDCTLRTEGLTLEKSNPMQKELYSLILSAKLSDKSIGVTINKGSKNCSISQIKILKN